MTKPNAANPRSQGPFRTFVRTFSHCDFQITQLPNYKITQYDHSIAQFLDEQIIKLHAVVKIFHAQTLIFAVGAIVVDVGKHSWYAVSRDAGDAQKFAVA